jgi:hypothetical protein
MYFSIIIRLCSYAILKSLSSLSHDGEIIILLI